MTEIFAQPERTSILVCNRKGGVGKTTVATSLAAHLAGPETPCAILDCDPQQSSIEWFARRGVDAQLSVIDAHGRNGALAQALSLRIPPSARFVIYDSPAIPRGFPLGELLRRVSVVLVPLLPSPIDLAASEGFIEELKRSTEWRQGAIRIGLVANRLRDYQRSSRQLRARTSDWGLPLVGEFQDTQLYVYASGLGRGVSELRGRRASRERLAWNRLAAFVRAAGASTGPPRFARHTDRSRFA